MICKIMMCILYIKYVYNKAKTIYPEEKKECNNSVLLRLHT